MLPCSPGACSISGEPQFVSPAARFFSTEKLIPQRVCSTPCGNCEPTPYFTFSKYLPLVDRWTSNSTAKRCADRHLLRQQFQCRKWLSKHYKAGFRDAFTDIANGENGEVPPVPPPKYWNTHYRTERGKRCVELYFDGYRAGSAMAAAELNTMKTIGASYDWSIQKPQSPCAATGQCRTGAGGPFSGAPPIALNSSHPAGFPGHAMPFQTGLPQNGCQSCQTGSPTPFTPAPFAPIAPNDEQPAVIPLSPGSSRSPDTLMSPDAGQGNYAPAAVPGMESHSPHSVHRNPTGRYGTVTQEPQQQPLVPDSTKRSRTPLPGLPTPGYASPDGASINLPSPQRSNLSSPSDPFPGIRSPDQRPAGPLTPGFSGNPPGQVLPGKLGPPDAFQSDPPVWQYPQPQP